ncbi:hypothetical protein O181_022758 [Austropuccinia psidii MF-1]|uniref:Uncharacterized protein n=1 Tax=Austropuccinia psidii MF-1 TaxID=1389203 RepID=A0A9Q3CHI6_9BASI|nr:hypothetical protein [Austropuccinia psidii MF-1]
MVTRWTSTPANNPKTAGSSPAGSHTLPSCTLRLSNFYSGRPLTLSVWSPNKLRASVERKHALLLLAH